MFATSYNLYEPASTNTRPSTLSLHPDRPSPQRNERNKSMLTANGLQPELQTNPHDDTLDVRDTIDDTGTTTATKATATEQYPPDRLTDR